MKKLLFLICFHFFCGSTSAQHFYVECIGNNTTENKVIDSIGYEKKHLDFKSAQQTSLVLLDKLQQTGYLESEILENYKLNDTLIRFKFSLGNKINYARIYIGINNQEFIPENMDCKNDSITLPFIQINAFLNSIVRQLETKGYAMAKSRLIDIEKKKGYITAQLSIIKTTQRNINDIVINGYPKFPEGHKKNITRIYRNKTFNQKSVEKIYTDFEKFRFVKQTKYPEILFTKDSTKIYVYLEKAKPNSFDGFLGFTNDENESLVVSGYLDLELNNILNSGEKIALYWKSDGMDQKTFNLKFELPYLFKSPLGLKTELNIFKQDSTFQNTKTNFELGYYFNYNTRAYLGYQSTESSDIQNINSSNLRDFENSFITGALEYTVFNSLDFLFPIKTQLNLKIGSGTRTTNSSSNQQFFGSLLLAHNFYLNSKNIINVKSHNFYLNSSDYITNELYRFGGISSFRGFNENSLQAHTFTSLLTEYRFVTTPNLYVHTLLDYGYFADNVSNSKENLLGIGFGFGLLTKNGLFNLVYANGSTKNQTIKLSNSIVHISFKANF